MKLSTKLKLITSPIAAFGIVAAPIFTATSCANDYQRLFFTIKNNKGMEIEFCDNGAAIYNMKVNGTNLTYHPQDKSAFVNPDRKVYFHGKSLGRVTGRFQDGKFTLDGKEHQLQVNEKSDTKNNCLHGGNDGWCYKNFKHWVIEDDNYTKVAFNYVSPAYEAGFPGSVDAWVVYTLYKNENKLDTSLFAVPSEKTVINMSTHSLFRIGNEGDVLNYTLTIPTIYRAKYDKEDEKKTGQIPVGKVDVTKETDQPFNFKDGKAIGQDILKAKAYDPVSGGYDHIWYVGDNTLENRYVNLYNPANKLNFRVSATNDNVTGFILYANDYPLKDTKMTDGKQDTIYAGITIEPYTYFEKDNIDKIIYTPEKPFYTSYTYEITEVK